MRIIFAGTPEFAVPTLKALANTHEVVAVFTQPDRRAGRGKKMVAPPVKQFAVEYGLPVFQPQSLKDQYTVIADLNADVMVVVAYGLLLPTEILNLPRLGCLNVHASILPRWRGAAPIQRSIEAGDNETGVAIMQMETGLDTGPVFNTQLLPISLEDSSASLHDKLAQLGAKALLDTLIKLSADTPIRALPQNHDAATYAHKINKTEAPLDWSRSALELHNQIRAFNPWPVCETYHENTRIRVWQSWPDCEAKATAKPGTIVATNPAIQVRCGSGVLALKMLQRDGAKAVSAEEFCNGYSLTVGDILGSKNHAQPH